MPPNNLSATLVLSPEQYQEIQQNAGAIELARAYTIEADIPLEEQGVIAVEANAELKAVKARIVTLEEQQEKFIAPAHQMIANAKALFSPALTALQQAETFLKDQLLGYNTRVTEARERAERERQEAERAARQKAAQEAAAARAKAEAEARAKEQAAAEAEAARKKAEAEGNAKAAKEAAEREAKLRAQAEATRESGEAKAQQAEIAASAAVPAPVVAEAPKLAGFSSRENWSATFAPNVTEDHIVALLVAAAAGTTPDKLVRTDILGLLSFDQSAANKLAKALKTKMQVPGLTATNRPTATSRGK